eukprot:4950014-Prymnesium_polylepis.1
MGFAVPYNNQIRVAMRLYPYLRRTRDAGKPSLEQASSLGRRRDAGADDRAARRQRTRAGLTCSGSVSLFIHASHSDGRPPSSAV